MINIFIFLAIAFLFTFLVGKLIEKIRVPWIFASLIFGAILAIYNPFNSITSSPTFTFLGQLGMYFLLFIIGFEIDLREIKRKSGFLLGATLFIISFEGIFGTLLIHFVFGYEWLISFLVALSFATVGEAVLIPILDEFKMVNSKLGQTIIGIGVLDDIIEVFTLILMVIIVGSAIHTHFNIGVILISLFILFLLTIGFRKLKKEGVKFNFLSVDTLFLFTMFVLFLFLGIGGYAEAAPLAAFLAGTSIRTFIPNERLKYIENEVRTICYAFFAPMFFLWVGVMMNMKYLLNYPLLIVLVIVVSSVAKILSSLAMGKKELGIKKSFLLGIGLSVRFSTSIIIIKILFESGLIGSGLYSVIVASAVIFTFIIPVVFSNLLTRWK